MDMELLSGDKLPDGLKLCWPRPIFAAKHEKSSWLICISYRSGYRFVWKSRASYMGYEYDALVKSVFHSLEDTEEVKNKLQALFIENFEKGPPYGACRRKSSSPRDSQRAKAYAWERTLKTWKEESPLSKEDGMKFLSEVCSTLNIKSPPTIKFWGTYQGCRARGNEITFSSSMFRKQIILHELAHCIINYIKFKDKRERFQGHGPEWMKVYINLMSQFLGYDKEELIKSAQLHKLKVKTDENLL